MGGTPFLDEIGDTTLSVQVKLLLRLLQASTSASAGSRR
jgi:transcriptional regulator with GAF, ATPase, and Fis domain